MSTYPQLHPAQRAELEALEERALTADELAARISAPWSEHELEDFQNLVSWFTRRYPTPFARLQATRHLAAQWQRNRPR